MIHNFKKEGKIVPSEITVKLLQQAMQQSDNKRFIIDGFPRNEENRAAFENIVGLESFYVNSKFYNLLLVLLPKFYILSFLQL